MSVLAFFAACVAGGVGAGLRVFADGLIRTFARTRLPTATILINLTGSVTLGLITGLADAHILSGVWRLILGGGLLGGYTTFSTASYETVRLLQQRQWLVGTTNAIGVLIIAVAGAASGYAIGLSL